MAIVGAGPAGYFAAQALQNLQNDDLTFSIDMFEKLPTPWGLVRSGVSPDHPKIKSVSKVFEKIATTDGFRLFGNVELGKDISLDELKENYDAVVIAVGASKGKKLGIPGEDLPGSVSSADFVPWYNGHPDYAELDISLNCETAVVIGAGNVAMDVARMLAIDPHELNTTDTADHALAALHNSTIRTVHLCARRGPEHAAFTAPELRELPKLESTSVLINQSEIEAALSRLEESAETEAATNLAAMLAIASEPKTSHDRKLEFHFLLTPKEIVGKDQVEEIIFTVNKVQAGSIIATDEIVRIKCGLVVTAIGYETELATNLEFSGTHLKNTDGYISENLYVVGWAKRGPSGVIGTNKSDSTEVMKLLATKLGTPKPSLDFKEILDSKNVEYVLQTTWQKINEAETAAGLAAERPRVKITDRKKLLSFRNN